MGEQLPFDVQDFHGADPFRLRVENGKGMPAYVTLLDPAFRKEGVTVDVPIMDDPVGKPNGHFQKYRELLQTLKGQVFGVSALYLWSPNMASNLDLFTLHIYEAVPGAETFQNLRIFRALLDPFQARPEICVIQAPWQLRETTRMALIVPAMSKMTIDFYFTYKEHAAPDEMPI